VIPSRGNVDVVPQRAGCLPAGGGDRGGGHLRVCINEWGQSSLHYRWRARKRHAVVSDMASMLDSLAASFDQELRDKERDLNQAHALLGNIQAEILESQACGRSAQRCKRRARRGEAGLACDGNRSHVKIGQALPLGGEVGEGREERERVVRDMANGQLAVVPGLTVYPRNDPEDSNGVGEREKASARAPSQRYRRLVSLHANLPHDPEGVRQECEVLREDLARHRKRRKEVFDGFVRFQADAGTGGRMNDYRRLIAAGVASAPSEVDGALGMLLECVGLFCSYVDVLNCVVLSHSRSEEPSSSSGCVEQCGATVTFCAVG